MPRKNLRLLAGRPLIEWTIEAAKQSAWLDEIAVTTEDDEIHKVAVENGVAVIRRPMSLATDTASVYDAIKHALSRMQGNFTHICLLQPTSPLRDVADIDNCCALAVEKAAHAVATVAESGRLLNGAVYVGERHWLLNGGNFDGPETVKVIMPDERSIDINTPEEFAEAERLMQVFG